MVVYITLGEVVAVVAATGVSLSVFIGARAWVRHVRETGGWRRWWRRMRLKTLGGVTTLNQTLSYNCTMCQYPMEAGEEVRTLSCNHAFHCRESEKCEIYIDKWFCTEDNIKKRMFCPMCRRLPLPVLPWKKPPASSPAQSPALPASPAPSEGSGRSQSSSGSESRPDLEDPLLRAPQ